MDTFVNPYLGEFFGNAVFIGIDIETGNFKMETIFDSNSKGFVSFFLKSSIKAILNGKIKYSSFLSKQYGALSPLPFDIVLHSYVFEISKAIEK